nr:hypothetical protein [Dyella sp. ASV24]
MKKRILISLGLACLAMTSAFAAPNAALERVLKNAGPNAEPAQVTRLREAIASSPALEAQLNALAASGQLSQFAIGEEAMLPSKPGPFSAWIHGSTWAFQTDFIDKHGKTRLMDVVAPGEMLPDNLVFALGHLAYKAETAMQMDAASIKTTPRDQWVSMRMKNDAEATIQAWNDTVDAAQKSNGGKVLAAGQVGSMILNLRYRAAFIKAMQAQGEDKLQFGDDGRIAMTPANVAAVMKALSTSSLFDVQ